MSKPEFQVTLPDGSTGTATFEKLDRTTAQIRWPCGDTYEFLRTPLKRLLDMAELLPADPAVMLSLERAGLEYFALRAVKGRGTRRFEVMDDADQQSKRGSFRLQAARDALAAL